MHSLRGIDASTRSQEDLDELNAVEACRQVERPVEFTARFDQHIDAFPVDAEHVSERGSNHIRLRDLAKQRPSGAHLDAHQVGV